MAAELSFYDKASGYVAESHALYPGAAELHNLHTITGIVALSRGELVQAVEYLAESVRACQKDGFARLSCSVREMNLLLAGRLLDYSQEAAVLSYLAACLRVWKHDEKRICGWIDAIKAGTRPEFSAHWRFKRPEIKMMNQITWGSFFTETPAEGLDHGTVEEFIEQVREENRRAVKGKLGTSNN